MTINVPLLRESFAELAPRSELWVAEFYQQLIEQLRHLQGSLVGVDLEDQRRQFLQSFPIILRLLDRPDALGRFVRDLGIPLAEAGVQAEDFEQLGELLLEVLERFSQDSAWTEETAFAWQAAVARVSTELQAGAASRALPQLVLSHAEVAEAPQHSAGGSPPATRFAPHTDPTHAVSFQSTQPLAPSDREPPQEIRSMTTSTMTSPVHASGIASTGAETFYGIVEASAQAMLFVDSTGVVTYLNRRGHELFRQLAARLGFAPEQLVGNSVDRLCSAIPELRNELAQLAAFRALDVVVGTVTLNLTLSPIYAGDGRRLGAVMTLEDVTANRLEAGRAAENAQNQNAINQLLTAIQSAETPEQAALSALAIVRDGLGWAYGSYWAIDPVEKVLKFSAESGQVTPEFARITATATFAEGVGLSGRAWRQRDLVFVEDLAKVTDCVRAPAAQRAGVKSGVCFPIEIDGKVVGTMDFFATETITLSDERRDALRNVGRLVSTAMTRLRDQAEQSRISNMVENMPINVLLANRDFELVYMNPCSVTTLKQIEHLLPRPVNQLLGQKIDIFHKNPEMQRKLLSDPRNLPHKARIKLQNEYLDLSVSAIMDKNGVYVGPMVCWSVATTQVQLADDFERDVKGVVEIVTSSATEMQASSRSMAAASEETARQSQVVAAASEQATRNVETVSSAAEELSKSISEIARHVQDASKMTAGAVTEAERTNVTIRQLGDSSNEIGHVVKVITSIAQQTNLLALNATIEAARAGEAGKGFAVVANEVKELARQTAKATEEISQKISAIQGATSTAVTAIGSIGESIRRINEISTTIASAVEEQTAATNEISRNVAEAARGTAEVSSNIAGVSQAAEEGGRGASDILSAAEGLAQESTRLDTVATDFLKRMRSL